MWSIQNSFSVHRWRRTEGIHSVTACRSEAADSVSLDQVCGVDRSDAGHLVVAWAGTEEAVAPTRDVVEGALAAELIQAWIREAQAVSAELLVELGEKA